MASKASLDRCLLTALGTEAEAGRDLAREVAAVQIERWADRRQEDIGKAAQGAEGADGNDGGSGMIASSSSTQHNANYRRR